MGVIEKQGIQGTIVTYVGVVIGFITAGLLIPILLTPEQIGVLDVLNAWSLIFATLATLGINNVTYRLFPWFRNPKNHHNGYLGILFLVLGLGLLLSTGVYLILRPYILTKAIETGTLLPKYVDFIIPLTVFTALFLVIDVYYAALYRSVKGIFHKDLLMRIYILIGLLAYVFITLEFSVFVIIYVAALSLPGILIAFNLLIDKEFVIHINRRNLSKGLVNNMLSVAFYGILVSFSNILIQKIDILMIWHFMDTIQVGLYSRVFFYGTLVAIPLRVLAKISAIVLAQSWKENKLSQIAQVYRKSTLDQLLIGALVFIGLCANIDNIPRMIGEEFAAGKMVVVYIGLSNLFLMTAGVSGAVISTSKSYKVLTGHVVVFGLLVLLTNWIFIPWLGIVGAAIASAISAFVYGAMRFVFLWYKYKLQPYGLKHLIILALAALCFGLSLGIPDLYDPDRRLTSMILDILVRSGAIAIVYLTASYILRLSPDLNRWINSIFARSS